MKKRKYKSVITKRIYKSIQKIGKIFGILLLIPVFSYVMPTSSNYMDIETSTANNFEASSLDISVSSETSNLSLTETSENMLAGEVVERNFEMSNDGKENVEYRIEFVKNSGDDALCSALQFEAKRNSSVVFEGNLNDLNEAGFSLNSGDDDLWEVKISLLQDTSTSLQELDCNFNFEFNSWIESKTEATSGWNDEEQLTGNEIHTGSWQDIVLNEFVPNPIGDDDANMPGGEWVELYNRGDVAVDVDGWFLYDVDDSHELEISTSNSDNNGDTGDSGETIVPVGGFLVVYRNGDGDFSLNNDGDSLRLFDGEISSGANLIDSHTYDGSDFDELSDTLLGSNVDDSSGTAKITIPEGKSFIRYPDGFDNWIDPIPTPGKANDDENGEDELLEYYKKSCFDKKGNPICEKDFMEALGLLDDEEDEEEIEEEIVQEEQKENTDLIESLGEENNSGDENSSDEQDDSNKESFSAEATADKEENEDKSNEEEVDDEDLLAGGEEADLEEEFNDVDDSESNQVDENSEEDEVKEEDEESASAKATADEEDEVDEKDKESDEARKDKEEDKEDEDETKEEESDEDDEELEEDHDEDEEKDQDAKKEDDEEEEENDK